MTWHYSYHRHTDAGQMADNVDDIAVWSMGVNDIIQIMHGSEWTLKYDQPEIENVA